MGVPNIGQGAASTQIGLPKLKVGPPKLKPGLSMRKPDPKLSRMALLSGMKGGC